MSFFINDNVGVYMGLEEKSSSNNIRVVHNRNYFYFSSSYLVSELVKWV